MLVDDRYFNDLMYVIAALKDESDFDEAEITSIRNRAEIILQQGRALLEQGKKSASRKTEIDVSTVPTWRDFKGFGS